MKKHKILAVLSIVCVIITLSTVTLAATGGLTEIKAYLNHDIKVYYNGELKKMYDVNGKEVFPVSYQGTTYVPIRAVSNMIGLNVDWDGATKSVLLGKTGVEKDFIEEFTPYAMDHYNAQWYRARFYQIKDNKTVSIGGKTINHYLSIGGECAAYFNIEGKYTTLTFDVYSDANETLYIFGDNDYLIQTIEVSAKTLPKTYTIDVTGEQQIKLSNATSPSDSHNTNGMFIFNAKIK